MTKTAAGSQLDFALMFFPLRFSGLVGSVRPPLTLG
jgi:hypothetical protein